jgi:hypothetical protein
MRRTFPDMHLKRLIVRFSSEKGRSLWFLLIAVLIPTILTLDLVIKRASLGILYIIAMVLSVSMRRRAIAALALFCAILSWWGDPSASPIDGLLILSFRSSAILVWRTS